MADTFVISHLDLDGNTVAEFENPAGLSWTYQIGAKGPGKIEYELSEADPGVTTDGFAPKRTDVRLSHNGVPIIEGPLWSVNMPLAGDTIRCVAHDWMQWLEQPPLYMFDYDTYPDVDSMIAAGLPDEMIVVFSGADTIQDVVEAILQPLQFNPAEQIPIYTSYSGTAFSETIVGHIERSAETSALSMLQELAQMGPPNGFDFWFDPDKTLRLVGPRRTNVGGYTTIYDLHGPETIVDGDWTNNGPAGTDILFTEGSGSTRRYWRKEHQPSVDQFRRWGYTARLTRSVSPTIHFGSATDGDLKAQAAQYRLLYPQKELTLVVKPEAFTFANRLMEAVDVDYTRTPGGYHRIDAAFWITSQTYRQTEEGDGDWLCDLTLDQIYPTP